MLEESLTAARAGPFHRFQNLPESADHIVAENRHKPAAETIGWKILVAGDALGDPPRFHYCLRPTRG